MFAPKTDKFIGQQYNGSLSKMGLSGVYYNGGTSGIVEVFNNGSALSKGELLTWGTGKGYMVGAISTTSFFVNVVEGAKPAIGDTITGSLSGASVSVSVYNSYYSAFDPTENRHQSGDVEIQASAYEFDSGGGTLYGMIDGISNVDNNNVLIATTFKLKTTYASQVFAAVGNTGVPNHRVLASLGGCTFYGSSGNFDTMSFSSTPSSQDLASGYGSFICHIDGVSEKIRIARYLPLASNTTELATLDGFTNFDYPWSETFTYLNPPQVFLSFACIFPTMNYQDISDDDFTSAVEELYTQDVNVSTAAERTLCPKKGKGLDRLIYE